MNNQDPRKVIDIASEPTPTCVPMPAPLPRFEVVKPPRTTISELARIAVDENRVVKASRGQGPGVLWLKPYSRRIPAMHISELAANDWYEVRE